MADLSIKIEELEGLPQELLEQLHCTKSKAYQNWIKVKEVLQEADAPVHLDKLLVLYYKKHGEVLDRTKTMALMYRLTQKGLVHTDKSRKGVYSLPSVHRASESEAAHGSGVVPAQSKGE